MMWRNSFPSGSLAVEMYVVSDKRSTVGALSALTVAAASASCAGVQRGGLPGL